MTASTETFRALVFGELQTWAAANFPTLPVVYENGPVPDEDTIGPIWLDVELRWYGAVIASVGANPRARDTGAVVINCFYREGAGTRQPDQILDSLRTLLTGRRLGEGTLWAPQRASPTNLRGWRKAGVSIPFSLG